MSMTSAQIDKLRKYANKVDDTFPMLANALRNAADTIWELRDDLQRANAENAKMREYVERKRHLQDFARLVSENSALRELVRDMMRFFEDGSYCTTCEKVAECDASEIYECDCLMHSVFADRMRELGVEIPGDGTH